jgi:hypothetical protein
MEVRRNDHYRSLTHSDDLLPLFSVDAEFAKLKLGDLTAVATLGVGGFGRVELVRALLAFFSFTH